MTFPTPLMNRMAELLDVLDDPLIGQGLALDDLIPCPELAQRAAEALASGDPHDHVLVTLQGRSDGRLLRTNSKMSQIVGYGEIEPLRRFFQQLTYEEDLADELRLIARLRAGEISDYRREKRLPRRDDALVWVSVNVSAMRDAHGNQRFICVIKDILQDRLGRAIVHAHRAARQVAVMFIDLDRFKHVSDSMGHDAGDHLIVEIARRLSSRLRESDTWRARAATNS